MKFRDLLSRAAVGVPYDPAPERALPVTRIFMDAGADPEGLLDNFRSFALHGFKTSGPVYSLVAARAAAFAEGVLQFQRLGDRTLFGTAALTPLEVPWPGGTAAELLAVMEVDVSLAGNAYVVPVAGGDFVTSVDRFAALRRTGRYGLQRVRPDWTVFVTGITRQGAVRLDYIGYYPEGRFDRDPTLFDPGVVAHYKETPDPLAYFRGQSWLEAVASEVDADTYMTAHKARFFTNAATPNLAITVEGTLNPEQRGAMTEQFAARYASADNAYKTVLLEGGASLTPLGHSFEQMAFTTVTAAGENRMASAAGVPPIVVGFKEGLQAATYSNYQQALRRFADLWCRPAWRRGVAALSPLVEIPPGARLWYDERVIPFLQQDAKDEAEIRQADASTLETLIRSGFTAESAKQAVSAGRFDMLEHTGLVSVQLQPPGTSTDQVGGTDNESAAAVND